jgi:hypothetical protein
MTALVAETYTDYFAEQEWTRLDTLSAKFDHQLKGVWLQTMVQGVQIGKPVIKDFITDVVVETGISTADVYGMGFNADSARWPRLIDSLTEKFMGVLDNHEAKDRVAAILPSGLSLSERAARLSVFGLSARDAVRLEHMRQKGISGDRLKDARLHMRVQRGNIVALTEVNRFVNATVESVWLDNSTITKARQNKNWLVETGGRVSNVTTLRGIPSRAKKSVVTRRDNRVCDYCVPLEGVTARIGSPFRTEYGVFDYPPFHPRCRCYMIVRF